MAQYFQVEGPRGQRYHELMNSHSVVLPAGARLVVATGQPGMTADGKMVTSSPTAHFEAALDCCDRALKAAGVKDGIARAHKMHCFVLQVEHINLIIDIWRGRYPDHRPTWMTVVVKELYAPGMLVEMQVESYLLPDE